MTDLTLARIASLHKNQHSSALLNITASIAMALVLAFSEPITVLIGWLALAVATASMRVYWLSRFDRNFDVPGAMVWERRYALACLANGVALALVFFLFAFRNSFAIEFVNLVCAVTGLVAIASTSVSLRCYLALVLPIIFAQTIWAYHHFPQHAILAIAISGGYLLIAVMGVFVFRRVVMGTLEDGSSMRTLLAEQQAVFNSSLIGIGITRGRKFIRVNTEFARVYGYPREAMEGQPSSMIYPSREAWVAAAESAEALLASGQVSYEREYRHPDGRQRWLLVQGTPIDPAQPGTGTLWAIADVTSRKEADLQLAARELAHRNLAETYRTLLETMPAMIWTTDSKGRYTFASERGTQALFGVAATELTGKVYSDFVTPDDYPKELAVFQRVLGGELLLDYASAGTRKDGRRIVISVSGAPLHDAAGNVIGASGTNVDITERQQRSTELGEARDLLRNAIENIPDAFALFDADDRLVLANNRYVHLYTNAKSFSDISGQTFEAMVRASIKKGEPIAADFQGDTEAWVAERIRRHRNANGQPFTYRIGGGRIIQVTENRTPDGGIVGVRTDITELENARTILTSAINSMSDGFVLFGPDDRVVLCNRPYLAMLEAFDPDEPVIGKHLDELIRRQVEGGQPIPPDFSGTTEEWIATRLAHHRRADGTPHIQQLASGRWIQSIRRRTPDGGMVVLRTDVSEFKQRELAAQELAQHDQLTGLPNRRLLHDRLLQALARARRSNGMVAVLLVDLDGFKPVNDAHGHRAGDEVLRVVAMRLREWVRAADTVARYGGDEFVVVLDGMAQRDDAGAVAAKIIEAIARPIEPVWSTTRNSPNLGIGCSIGISLYPSSDTHPDALIRLADLAMYQAKQAGRGRYRYHAKCD